MKNIIFTDYKEFDTGDAFVAIIPSDIEGEDSLFQNLSSILIFPDYFGDNWNALWDMLCDFSWIEQRVIVMIHEDIPKLEEDRLKMYLNLLEEAVETWQNWKNGEEHILHVVFPKEAENLLKRYLLQ